jgi:hypothetical protein
LAGACGGPPRPTSAVPRLPIDRTGPLGGGREVLQASASSWAVTLPPPGQLGARTARHRPHGLRTMLARDFSGDWARTCSPCTTGRAIGPPPIGIERGAPRAVAMPERADSTTTTPVRPSSVARGGRIVLMACSHHGNERAAFRHAVTPGSRWGRLPRRRKKARIRESLASRWWGAGR